jgi:ferrous-iron efflux pump FieF
MNLSQRDPAHQHNLIGSMHETTHKSTSRLPQLASYASLSVALVLVGLKVWAWLETDSVAVLSSLADSFLDVLAATITVVAVWISSQPADSEHRFGHGKSEGLAALVQSFIISLSALYVCSEAIQRISEPEPVSEPAIGIGVMGVAIALTLALQSFQHYVVKQTGSMAIAADAAHYRSDLMINFGAGASMLVSMQTDVQLIDPLIGIVIAGIILFSAYGIAKAALDVLLDRELSVADRQRLFELATEHPDVLGFHDLRTRFGGSHYFIQFHLELAPEITLMQTHVILDEVEDRVRSAFPKADIIIHPDPMGFDEQRDDFDD